MYFQKRTRIGHEILKKDFLGLTPISHFFPVKIRCTIRVNIEIISFSRLYS